ncbi:ADP-ribosylation factor [Aspergillus sclerotiicarbonarius CBS 121057]|uniref:ADP-ribosylation factor n=1 Tax=Aspergillus sclerotiicarbonarius (strain CBS 121057 / IBT 28362) TaxID=1448318 RepID=A0A319EP52_ASPSB|nr:ADP-ribosylation factor [Aspergillus sclerotiicarbonarius CBS 121057]
MSELVRSHIFQTPEEYYSSFKTRPHLQDAFRDIDEANNLKTYLALLKDSQTRNFVLDFGNDDAWCAVNLNQEDFALLLRKPKPRFFGTRWINIWAPEQQKELIKTLTGHYGVSERLQGMMCTDPVERPSKPTMPAEPPRNNFRPRNTDRVRGLRPDDVEGNALRDLADPEEIRAAASFRGLTFANVIDQIWHFCSVDYGPKYTCVGYNSLFVVPHLEMDNGKELPAGKRLWSWLILCDDGTVICMQENPFPGLSGPSEKELQSVLSVVRRNMQLIFAGVSKQHFASSESDSLVTIRVRPFFEGGPDQVSIKQDDGPSLLFYYIFDDWVSSYALVAQREHKYGVSLNRLRQDMLSKPVVDLIHELHRLGRQLAVLKRLYQSYELVMMRILQRQRMLRDEARANRPQLAIGQSFGENDVDTRHSTSRSSFSFSTIPDASVGVQLSPPAVARFERLLDRIKLYCLSEIDSCLTEKENLTFLNFNLIALKDSQAVEKLTRITILLAKVTILFLPVSLMTGYFSTELRNVKGEYTINQYWVSFGVIMFLSAVLLWIFGYASDTVEGKTIYQSLSRSFFRMSRDRVSNHRNEAPGGTNHRS